MSQDRGVVVIFKPMSRVAGDENLKKYYLYSIKEDNKILYENKKAPHESFVLFSLDNDGESIKDILYDNRFTAFSINTNFDIVEPPDERDPLNIMVRLTPNLSSMLPNDKGKIYTNKNIDFLSYPKIDELVDMAYEEEERNGEDMDFEEGSGEMPEVVVTAVKPNVFAQGNSADSDSDSVSSIDNSADSDYNDSPSDLTRRKSSVLSTETIGSMSTPPGTPSRKSSVLSTDTRGSMSTP
jgi:hypothetical protein